MKPIKKYSIKKDQEKHTKSTSINLPTSSDYEIKITL